MGALCSATPTPKLATFEHLLQIPEDDRFHEVLDGELTRKGLPSGEHSLGQGRLTGWLDRFNRRRNSAERPGGWWNLPEPFGALELPVGILFGDDPE
jgi:Uma2 family endonuclease